MFTTSRSYKPQKQSSALPMVASQMSGKSEQQQQPANYSSDNAKTAPCLTPFSHPAPDLHVPNNSRFYWDIGDDKCRFGP